MALIYRAIWAEDGSDLCDRAQTAFEEWVRSKYPTLEVPSSDSAALPDGSADVEAFQASTDAVSTRRLVLHEERDGQRWTTTMLAMDATGDEPTIWVDVEYVSRDTFALADVVAPRLVRDLIDHGVRPHRGPTTLRTTPAVCTGAQVDALAEALFDPTRDVPILVFSSLPPDQPGEVVARATRAAEILAGVAVVEVLSPDAVDQLIDRVGRSLGVWGGAARVYLPGLRPGAYPYPHFVVRPEVVTRRERQAGLTASRRLASSITARRAPDCYERARPLLAGRFQNRTLDEVEVELEQAWAELDTTRSALASEQDRYLDAAADLEELNAEVTSKIRAIEELTRALVESGVAGSEVVLLTTDSKLPVTAASCTEAAAYAQACLSRVEVPDLALRDLDDLDAAIEAQSWGATAWRGFRALQAYALDAERFSGFWNWCQQSGHAWAWPATPKKLAMTESEGVMNDRSLRDRRLLPVDAAVDAGGVVLMTAHLKIAEGGGPLAPRIYFHDDTKGSTKKVHVGYFGPHRNLPNQKTN